MLFGGKGTNRWLLTLSFIVLTTAGCTLMGNRSIQGQIIFEEYFRTGETGNWLTESDSQGQSLVANEAMVIELDQPGTVQYVTLQEPAFGDFVLDVDITQTEGSLNSSFGILFRMQGDAAFYRFSITGNGLYILEKRIGEDGWERLSEDWPESTLLLRGLNQTNQLRVEAIGPQLSFYINDQPLTSIVDSSYAGGRIALAAGTFNQGGLRVAFDNVVVTHP